MKKELSIKEKLLNAREILNTSINNEGNQKNYLDKLRYITERAELSYNNVKVKKYKCKQAIQMMQDIEHELDELLNKEIKNFKIKKIISFN